MASFKQAYHCSITILYTLLFLCIQSTAISTAKNGFSLELIHHDYSPSSPFYNPNLTFIEYLNRQAKFDRSRLQYLSFLATQYYKTTNSAEPKMIRPPIFEHKLTYMVSLAIGTGSGRNYYMLNIDTGSGLTWIQCVPCSHGFKQKPPIFDPRKSPTYRTVGCSEKLCKGPQYICLYEHNCTYHYNYGDNTYSSGYFAYETFSFITDRGYNVEQQVNDVAFGCAHSTTVSYPIGGAVGIMGLSVDSKSFIKQLKDVTGSQFSYCLATPGTTHHGNLRFGTDILVPDPAKTQKTRIIQYARGRGLYYLNLIDISVGNKRMNIRPGMFMRQASGKGGTIIDSGTTFSYIIQEAFEEVSIAMRNHFRKCNIKEVDCSRVGVDSTMCFKYPVNPPKDALPDMTWHFEGADYKIEWRKLFSLDQNRGYFFVLLKSDPDLTILGAIQQIDYRFIYDGSRLTLSFAPADCSNAA